MGIFSSIGSSILWFSTTWLIYGLGGSNSDLGRILGLATLIGLAGSLLISGFADTFRRDVLIWVGGLFLMVGSYMLATSNNLDDVFVGQIIVSIGGSSLFPTLGALFADSIPAKNRNRVFGTQFLLSNSASAVGNLVGYFIFRGMDADVIESLDVDLIKYSILIATVTQVIAFVFMLLLRDGNAVSEAEEGTIASNYIRENKNTRSEIRRKWYRGDLIDRSEFAPGSLQILLLSLISAYLIGLGAGISIPYFPRFFFDIYDIDLAELSILFAFVTLITAIWGKINANLADKYGRVELIVVNQIVSVTLLVILATYPPILFALLALIVRNAAMNGVGPVASAIQMEYSPRKYRSKINALNMVSWALLFSIGQIIGGILVDKYEFRPPILITAFLYLLATFSYWRIKKISSNLEKE
ncbi:MAG: MFS transporter [Candidatus Heimdallarchaeota archaeon]|nr:MFS transporter [Candidatus Heimdallarchaeota archaeon]